MDYISKSLWTQVCTYLSIRDLGSFGQVCKRFHGIVTQDILWKKLYQQIHPEIDIKSKHFDNNKFKSSYFNVLKKYLMRSENIETLYYEIGTFGPKSTIFGNSLCSINEGTPMIEILNTEVGEIYQFPHPEVCNIQKGIDNRLLVKLKSKETQCYQIAIFNLSTMTILDTHNSKEILENTYINTLNLSNYKHFFVLSHRNYMLLLGDEKNPGIYLWNLDTGRFFTLNVPETTMKVVNDYFKDNPKLIGACKGNYFFFPIIKQKIIIFDFRTETIKQFDVQEKHDNYTILGSRILLFSNDEQKANSYTIEVIDILTGRMLPSPCNESISWHQQYKDFLLCATDTEIIIFDNNMNCYRRLIHTHGQDQIIWVHVEKDILLTRSTTHMKIWSLPEGKLLDTKLWPYVEDRLEIRDGHLMIVDVPDFAGLTVCNIKTPSICHRIPWDDEVGPGIFGIIDTYIFLYHNEINNIYIFDTKQDKIIHVISIDGKIIDGECLNNVLLVKYTGEDEAIIFNSFDFGALL